MAAAPDASGRRFHVRPNGGTYSAGTGSWRRLAVRIGADAGGDVGLHGATPLWGANLRASASSLSRFASHRSLGAGFVKPCLDACTFAASSGQPHSAISAIAGAGDVEVDIGDPHDEGRRRALRPVWPALETSVASQRHCDSTRAGGPLTPSAFFFYGLMGVLCVSASCTGRSAGPTDANRSPWRYRTMRPAPGILAG
jgi:hypothetical protein